MRSALRTVRARRDEKGVTIVEAAFVIPVFFLLAFGMIDMGMWVLNTSQSSSAARDGARAGIVLQLNGATGAAATANTDKIEAAVEARLTGQNPTVVVTCRDGDDGSVKQCRFVEDGKDRLEVKVSWQRPFLTFLGGLFGAAEQTITGTSSMVVVGKPTQG